MRDKEAQFHGILGLIWTSEYRKLNFFILQMRSTRPSRKKPSAQGVSKLKEMEQNTEISNCQYYVLSIKSSHPRFWRPWMTKFHYFHCVYPSYLKEKCLFEFIIYTSFKLTTYASTYKIIVVNIGLQFGSYHR